MSTSRACARPDRWSSSAGGGAGGVIVPPKTYFQKVMAVCAKHDVFVISDEVICGFGRLGTLFGCEKLGFKPQAISVAKALSSAYLPIGAVMIPELMYEALLAESNKLGAFGHGFTYGGHPVSAAVAVKAIEIYGRDCIIAKAARARPCSRRGSSSSVTIRWSVKRAASG